MFWKILKTDHDFVMKPGLRVHLKGLRTQREIVDYVQIDQTTTAPALVMVNNKLTILWGS